MAVMIRLMKPEDERPLRKLVMRYLKETYDMGGEIPPTLENTAMSIRYAIDGAEVGDPCLVAEDDGKIIGYIIARGISFPGLTTRYKSIRSWGTFVLPQYRTKDVGTTLFIVAGRLARIAGYERFIGYSMGTGYEEHALSVVNRIPGMQEIGKVVMMDLTRKTRDTSQPVEGKLH